VSGNEAGIVLIVRVATKKKMYPKAFLNHLVSDKYWTLRARTDDDQSPVLDNKDNSDITVPPSGSANEDVENHHGLYWNRDGVLEEPQNKSPLARGCLKLEYENNFATSLDSMMSIFPLIYWKIIVR
jgi:hypothetical protein